MTTNAPALPIATTPIVLNDQRTMNVNVSTCPMLGRPQLELISLLRTAWTRTDYDWLESMWGDYADTLTIHNVIGRVNGEPVGAASVCLARDQPEVATIGNVITHPSYRRLGVAEHLVNIAAGLAFKSGCRVIYLGTTPKPRCVYERCGFHWHNGSVMRRTNNSDPQPEHDFFTPGQPTTSRDAQWGDLPALACFAAQPIQSITLDYARGLISGNHVTLQRCVSNFPVIHEAVRSRDGVFRVLIGDAPNRILGFGTITPGPSPAQQHTAQLDFVVHDHYEDTAQSLLEELLTAAADRDIRHLEITVADRDHHKQQCLQAAHFQKTKTHQPDLLLKSGPEPVQVWIAKI